MQIDSIQREELQQQEQHLKNDAQAAGAAQAHGTHEKIPTPSGDFLDFVRLLRDYLLALLVNYTAKVVFFVYHCVMSVAVVQGATPQRRVRSDDAPRSAFAQYSSSSSQYQSSPGRETAGDTVTHRTPHARQASPTNGAHSAEMSDDKICYICHDQLVASVAGACGHEYCGQCIIDYWVYEKKRLSCPVCRRPLHQLYPRERGVDAELDHDVAEYNMQYATSQRSFMQVLREIPFIQREAMRVMSERSNFEFFVQQVCRSHYAIMSCLYILSPIDLLPEIFLGIFGLIDDMIVSVMLLVLVSDIQYRLLHVHNTRNLVPPASATAAATTTVTTTTTAAATTATTATTTTAATTATTTAY